MTSATRARASIVAAMAVLVAVPAGPVAAPAVIARSVTARAAIVCRHMPSISRRAATIAIAHREIVLRAIALKWAQRRANAPTAPARMPTVPIRPVRKAIARSAVRRAAMAVVASAAAVVVVAEAVAGALPRT